MHHIDAYYRSMGVNIYITTCRDIQTAVVKTCAYTDLDALKCSFGEEYNELYPIIVQFIPRPLFIYIIICLFLINGKFFDNILYLPHR